MRSSLRIVVLFSVMAGILLFFGRDNNSLLKAQVEQRDETASLQIYFQRLVDNDAIFTLFFATPVNGKQNWELPAQIENAEGGIIGRELIAEVGTDYICVDAIGQGFTTVTCIPFSNIAYIEHYGN
ncbi:MAG: hypothetical protein H6672_01575 [Anaerolineaceae bacterium]|nr:hypothetical protein [Anaerolineaceae bacterium]